MECSCKKAIKELTSIWIKEVHDDIILINHQKKEVRDSNVFSKIISFLMVLIFKCFKTPLSEWDQIQLLEILQNFEDQKIPDITDWLESKKQYCCTIY
jgi:hypothetical protein